MASLRRKVRYKKTRSGLPPIVIQIFDIKKATLRSGFFLCVVCLGVQADFNREKTSTSATAWVLHGL